jgi:hypothetical protein
VFEEPPPASESFMLRDIRAPLLSWRTNDLPAAEHQDLRSLVHKEVFREAEEIIIFNRQVLSQTWLSG